MITLQTEPTVITTDIGRALRSADYLVFHYRGGRSYIRVCKDNVGVWKETKEIEIDCGLKIENYGGYKGHGDVRSASYVLTNARYDLPLQTTLSKIRKGDTLTLLWRACNNNTHLDNAGLFCDTLFLLIERNGKKEYYHLDTQISANNTARMIKDANTPYSVCGE